MATPLSNALEFLKRFGFFDVVLPFLLIFTLVFAILEKTKVLGVTKDGKPKANINSMISFVIALFFIAIPQVVVAVQESLPYVGILLVVIVAYLLMVGSYASGDKEFNFENMKYWKALMSILVGVGGIVIFLNSFGWLDTVLDYIVENWQATFIPSLVFVAIMIGAVYWIVSSKGDKT